LAVQNIDLVAQFFQRHFILVLRLAPLPLRGPDAPDA
jgi:hypothetical protein